MNGVSDQATEEQRTIQRISSETRLATHAWSESTIQGGYNRIPLSGQFIINARAGGRGNGSTRGASLQAMQSTHGNRAVQRFMQRGSSPNTAKVSVQRSPEQPFDDMFPEQAYDTPTEEEMKILEDMYQKGLAEDTAATEVGTTATEVGTTAAEVGTTTAEVGTTAAEVGTVAAEGGTAAGGLGAGAILPLAAAGLAGFGVGTAIGKYGIDPYLNRPHMEDASASDNYKDKWSYKINHWLGDQ